MEKQDRRVIRSKMRMREALISLMQEKLFPEIFSLKTNLSGGILPDSYLILRLPPHLQQSL